MKTIVNIGINYNGRVQRAEEIVDDTRGFADGYVIPCFGRKYENEKDQEKFDLLNLSAEDLDRLLTYIGPKYLKIIEPANHRDLDNVSEKIDGIKLLSEHFDNEPMCNGTKELNLPMYLDTSGLSAEQISSFISAVNADNLTLLHGNGRFTQPRDPRVLNMSHVLDIAEVAYNSGVEQFELGFVYRGSNAFVPVSVPLLTVDYLEIFVDLTDGLCFETDFSFKTKDIDVLKAGINFMLSAYSCGCFNIVEDVLYLTKNRRDTSTWLVPKKEK